MNYNLASLSLNFTKIILSKDSFQITQVNSICSVIILIKLICSFKRHCQLHTSNPSLQTYPTLTVLHSMFPIMTTGTTIHSVTQPRTEGQPSLFLLPHHIIDS